MSVDPAFSYVTMPDPSDDRDRGLRADPFTFRLRSVYSRADRRRYDGFMKTPTKPAAETLTAYQSYRSMSWTTDADECEEGCGTVMAEGRYVEGRYGHYCSKRCARAASTGGGADEPREDFHSDG